MRRWRGFCPRRVAILDRFWQQRQLSVALEHYLDGSAGKDEAEWFDRASSRRSRSSPCPIFVLRAFKDAARHIKMVDDLIHRQHQTIRHLQRSIDSIDYKSRLIKRMDLELAALESKQPLKGALSLDAEPSVETLQIVATLLNQPAPDLYGWQAGQQPKLPQAWPKQCPRL